MAATKIYKVLYAFDKTDEEELSIQPGDNLMGVGEADDGWIEVRNLATGKAGFVPVDYIEESGTAGAPKPEPPKPTTPIAPPNPAPTPAPVATPAPAPAPIPQTNTLRPPPNQTNQRRPSTGGYSPLQSQRGGNSADTSSYDPIENIAGKTGGMFSDFRKHGCEDYINGMIKGDGNPDFNESAKYLFAREHNGGIITVRNGSFNVESQSANDPYQIEIKAIENDSKGKKQFQVTKLDANLQPTAETAVRNVKDFDWLDTHLRRKYPFINIPAGPFQSANEIPINRWMTYLTSHPILRTSYALQCFRTVNDARAWKDVKSLLDKKDKNLNAEMFRLIEVDPTVGIENLQENLREAVDTVTADQEHYDRGFNSTVTFIKEASDLERRKVECYAKLCNELDKWSLHLEKIPRQGCGSMSIGLKKVSKELHSLSSEDVKKEKMLAAAGLQNNVSLHRQSIDTWTKTPLILTDLTNKFQKLTSLRFENKLQKKQMSNATGRCINVLNVYQAESNHLIHEINKTFRKSVLEFLDYEVSQKQFDLEKIEAIRDHFKNIDLEN